MKLKNIPGNEPTIKQSFAFRKSTVDTLQRYQHCYKVEHGTEVSMKDMVEHMLVLFMAEDKSFQQHLRKPGSAGRPADPLTTDSGI